jgi:hypothetical protein
VVLVDRKYMIHMWCLWTENTEETYEVLVLVDRKAGILFHDPDDCYFAALYLNITFLLSSVQNDVQKGFKH